MVVPLAPPQPGVQVVVPLAPPQPGVTVVVPLALPQPGVPVVRHHPRRRPVHLLFPGHPGSAVSMALTEVVVQVGGPRMLPPGLLGPPVQWVS